MMIKADLEEKEAEIEYLEKWIELALKSIKTPRYKSMPLDIMDSIHFDKEGYDIWEKEETKCDDECCTM